MGVSASSPFKVELRSRYLKIRSGIITKSLSGSFQYLMMECVVVLAPWEIAIICLGSRKVPLQMDPIYARFKDGVGVGGKF